MVDQKDAAHGEEFRLAELLAARDFPHEPLRVACCIHEKADDAPAIVDAIDQGRADTVGLIDRLKLSRGDVIDEPVHFVCGVRIRSDDFAMVVQAKSLCQSTRRNVDHDQRFSCRDHVPMVYAGAVHIEPGNVAIVVDARRLSAESGSRDRGKSGALHGVGVLGAVLILRVACGLSLVVQTQKLVEARIWSIDGGKGTPNVKKSVGNAGAINVKAGRVPFRVDSNDLRLNGVGKVLSRKCHCRNECKSLVRMLSVRSTSMIPSDLAGVINPQELGKRISSSIDRCERKYRRGGARRN